MCVCYKIIIYIIYLYIHLYVVKLAFQHFQPFPAPLLRPKRSEAAEARFPYKRWVPFLSEPLFPPPFPRPALGMEG